MEYIVYTAGKWKILSTMTAKNRVIQQVSGNKLLFGTKNCIVIVTSPRNFSLSIYLSFGNKGLWMSISFHGSIYLFCLKLTAPLILCQKLTFQVLFILNIFRGPASAKMWRILRMSVVVEIRMSKFLILKFIIYLIIIFMKLQCVQLPQNGSFHHDNLPHDLVVS